MAKLKINCSEVYRTGKEIDELCERFNAVIEKIEKSKNNIFSATVWAGSDSISFNNSLSEHIENLKSLKEYFGDKNGFVKNSAVKHNAIAVELNDKVKRVGDNVKYKY